MPAPTKAKFQHIAARVFDTPLLIQQSKLLTILRVLGPRLGFELEGQPGMQPSMMDDDHFAPPDPFAHMEHLQALGVDFEPMEEGHFVGEHVAVIPVTGSLVQRSSWMADVSGMQSYASLERMMLAADADPRVREMLWEFDTPGGEVAGCFDFGDRIFDYRSHGGKPMTAVVSELAASAGYELASSVGNIALSRTSSVGSIGVVGAHVDYSKAMEKRGTAITFVYAGSKKVDGNPYQPLPAAVKAEWQAEIDSIYELFVETVARNTGLSTDKVRATQAGMYSGSAAIESGLAMRLNTFSNEFSNAVNRAKESRSGGFYPSMSREASAERWAGLGIRNTTIKQWQDSFKNLLTVEKEYEMNKEELAAKEKMEAEAKAKVEAENKAKAEAEAKAKTEAAAADGDEKIKAAVKADRVRCKAIAELPEAKGREKMAATLADKGMSVEEAKEILASAPKASGLDELMNGQTPGITGQEADDKTGKTSVTPPSAVYERRAAIFSGTHKQ